MSLDFIKNTYLIIHSVYRAIAICPRTQHFNSPELCTSTPLRCKLSNLHLTEADFIATTLLSGKYGNPT